MAQIMQPQFNPSAYVRAPKPVYETEVTIFLTDESVHRLHFPEGKETLAERTITDLGRAIRHESPAFSYVMDARTEWIVASASIVSYSIKREPPNA
jgi:hypothetical protein